MKFSPIYWVLSSVVLLAGVGMMGAAFAMEYNSHEEEGVSFTESFSSAENLKAELSNCTLTLKSDKEAENFTVEFVNASGNPKTYMDGDTLHVEQKQKQQFRLVDFGFGKWKNSGEVIITVPEQAFDQIELFLGYTQSNEISTISCKKLQIDCGVGVLNITDLRIADDLDLDQGTGDVLISDVKVAGKCNLDIGVGKLNAENFDVAKSSDIDLGTGDCIVRNCAFASIDVDSGVGDTDFNSVKFAGDAEFSQGTGDLTLHVSENTEHYSVKVEKGIGDVTINGEKSTSLLNHDAEYEINVEAGTGDVAIRFAE